MPSIARVVLAKAAYAAKRVAPGANRLLPKWMQRLILLHLLDVNRPYASFPQSASRRFLEDQVLPWLRDACPRILFVGAGSYTFHYEMGMSQDTMAKVFEPFFTTKPIGQGTGLGLSMIYGFAKQTRGHVRLESAVGEGSTFRLYLPRFHGAVEEKIEPPVSDPATGSGETVMVVEDDAGVRLIISDVLRELGYACLEASDGQAALPILTSNTPLDLLITDVGLPGLNGRQLAEMARQHRPELKVLFVTGYAEHTTGSAPFLGPGMEMVTKPFTLDALALKIREMLGK